MNTTKLNELAAKAMGWQQSENQPNYWDITGEDMILDKAEYQPSMFMDQALSLIEKICRNRWYLKHWKEGYSCGPIPDKWAVTAKTAPLAMTVCALRASGVSESEIKSVMEE